MQTLYTEALLFATLLANNLLKILWWANKAAEMNVQILGLEEVAKIKCNDKGSYLEASLKLPALEIGSLKHFLSKNSIKACKNPVNNWIEGGFENRPNLLAISLTCPAQAYPVPNFR